VGIAYEPLILPGSPLVLCHGPACLNVSLAYVPVCTLVLHFQKNVRIQAAVHVYLSATLYTAVIILNTAAVYLAREDV
jgi:hypothetical protein